MAISLPQLSEESFQIAWVYLERTGELGDGATASRFLSDAIEAMIRRGERNRIALSNRAISAYRRFRVNGTTASPHGTRIVVPVA
jgi:type IV secretory pathway TrbF-like protein